jgi:hypothetical protein
MELERNDTIHPEIVELSAWEWSDVPIKAIRGILSLFSGRSASRPCMGPPAQWKREDVHLLKELQRSDRWR